jgi:predicted permease
VSGWPFRRVLRPGQVRSDLDEEIRDEIELYLELRTRELVDEGMAPDAARRLAEERFGDASHIQAQLRRQASQGRSREGMMRVLEMFRRDLFYAVRTLRKSAGFTAVAVLTLGLAAGGNAAIFSVVDAALLQALPFADHEELVFLNGYHLVDGEISIRGASFPEFRDWKEAASTVGQMAATSEASLALTGEGQAERVQTEIVTADYFDALGVSAVIGRTFDPVEHEEVGAHPVAAISWNLYERRFGADPAALGQTLVVNDQPLTIAGVLPPGFGGVGLATDLWVPEGMISLLVGPQTLEQRGSRFLTVIGRLAPGAELDVSQAEMDQIARTLQESFPRAHEDRFAQVEPFREGYLGTTGNLLWLLLGAGGVLLLIAAANVANLLLVRSHGRSREIVLRRALGAEGSQVAAQLLTESVILSLLGGVAGLAFSSLALSVLGPMIPQGVLPGYVDPALSVGALVYSTVLLAIVGIATGLAPAVSSARFDLATRLREGSNGAGGRGRGRINAQHAFVVAQVALALVLMVGAGLLTRSFRAQLAVDVGSDIDGVVAMSMRLPASRYDSNETIVNFTSELERRLSEVPGAVSASVSSDLPFRNGASGSYILRDGDGPDDRIRFHRHSASAGFFATLDVEVLQGRALDRNDIAGAPDVIVVTEALADRVYPGTSALGQTMHLRPDGTMPVQVVGVIRDIRFRDVTTSLLADANSPDVFFAMAQSPTRSVEAAVRTGGDPSEVMAAMRAVVSELDPDLPVYNVAPLVDAFRIQTATPRFAAFLMGLFSVLAAVLASVGIYGVLAFSVDQRSKEIAIRRAIGASTTSLARSVIGDGLRLAAIGLVVGGVATVFVSSLLQSFLFEVGASDPTTIVTTVVAMIGVAAIAAIVPAARAMARSPADALNAE